MQSDQTGRAGHFIVTFLLVQGAKADPNLKTTGARVYRLVTRDSLEDEYRRQEEAKAKLVPLAADPRPEAKQLLAELCSPAAELVACNVVLQMYIRGRASVSRTRLSRQMLQPQPRHQRHQPPGTLLLALLLPRWQRRRTIRPPRPRRRPTRRPLGT